MSANGDPEPASPDAVNQLLNAFVTESRLTRASTKVRWLDGEYESIPSASGTIVA
jgi:hypothetical protein